MQIFSVYQPIISANRKSVAFVEALGRGKEDSGNVISPTALIQEALETHSLEALDRSFILSALAGWQERQSEQLLSINIDVRTIGNHSVDFLCQAAATYAIAPARIILEICENESTNTQLLLNFVNRSRQHGFLIGIDDLGKEFSNLDRIVTLAPDLIKLDRELVTGVHQDPQKRALVRSMVRFGEECGAQVVAEGLECWEDIFALMEQGIDLFQGYYFARPRPEPYEPAHWLGRLDIITKSFTAHRTHAIGEIRKLRENLDHTINRLTPLLARHPRQKYDRILAKFAYAVDYIECLYLIDEWGMQLTPTHFHKTPSSARSRLFAPAHNGHNHSQKHYFQNLPRQGTYLSELYISQATGNECRTLSCWVQDDDHRDYILCIDFANQEILHLASSRKFQVEYCFEI
jgi:EAL domain-containing protein (putative c-di-GMP-specific phosphodiesterase class I)